MALHFIALMGTPFLFLTPNGRNSIGLRAPLGLKWLLYAVVFGVMAAVAMGALGTLLYGPSPNNWFVGIGMTLLANPQFGDLDFTTGEMFLALAVPAALFSPIGEEIFFRGVVHELIAADWSHKTAAVSTSIVFGVMHLFHHGVTVGPGGLEIRVVSGLIWVLLTVALSVMFTVFRLRSRSIWSAVVCHSAFNVTMIGVIVFYYP